MYSGDGYDELCSVASLINTRSFDVQLAAASASDGCRWHPGPKQGCWYCFGPIRGADVTWDQHRGADVTWGQHKGADVTWDEHRDADITWDQHRGGNVLGLARPWRVRGASSFRAGAPGKGHRRAAELGKLILAAGPGWQRQLVCPCVRPSVCVFVCPKRFVFAFASLGLQEA
eukprot:gene4788-biopygen4407